MLFNLQEDTWIVPNSEGIRTSTSCDQPTAVDDACTPLSRYVTVRRGSRCDTALSYTMYFSI